MKQLVRKLYLICIGLLLCGLLAGVARADTFQLTDGSTLAGDIVSYNEAGLVVRIGDGKYSDRVPWTKFSQADLKKLEKNPKITPLVEPFIEVSQAEVAKKTQVKINKVDRLERPKDESLLGAMVSSSVGLTVLLLLYAANIYAGFEVAIYRSQPPALVCGVAAIAPVLGPIIFLSLPTRVRSAEPEVAESVAASQTQTFSVPGQVAPSETTTVSGARLAASHAAESGAIPATQVFQRGQFMFNRRFFETKFPGFFGMVRRDADRNMVLLFKTARGEFLSQRISRITANEIHLQIQKGAASEEIMVPFTEVKEVQLKHKNAP